MAVYVSPVDAVSMVDVSDLCSLTDLTEKAMLENLANRFSRDEIYTYVGTVLIAVNPFRLIPIYQPKHFDLYRTRPLGALSPHIFAIADSAYTSMLKEKRNQCVIVSGESGSGKTESTKYMLRYLMAVSNKLKNGGVEQKIIASGFVLEAFGNATTVSNNNSSRFGKFLSLKFREDGAFTGASIEKYLLEKSRIVYQAERERNYHVFYYLLAGADDSLRRKLWLKSPEYYHFLNQGGLNLSVGEEEKSNYRLLIQSMEKVGFSDDTRRRIFTVLSAVLHLGNILFENKTDLTYSKGVDVKNMAQLKVVSDLLEVKFDTLHAALTVRRNRARGETVLIPYSKDEAVAARDAMAKALYGSLFNWILEQSNKSLVGRGRPGRAPHRHIIGLLDIFGFELFPVNRFEQFCINYANEQLQFYFNQHIFRLEQEEYTSEGINWACIDYLDNRSCLDLIARKPSGLMQLLDDESRLASATDYTLFEKFNKEHKDHPHYYVPQLKKKDPVFGIQHYAGNVVYHLQGFREKNSDLVRPDIVAVLKGSVMLFLRQIIKSDPVVARRWNLLRCVAYFCGTLLYAVKVKKLKLEGKDSQSSGDKISGGRKDVVLRQGSSGASGGAKRRDIEKIFSVQEKVKCIDTSVEMSSQSPKVGGRKQSGSESEDRKRTLSDGLLQRHPSKARFLRKNRSSKFRTLKETDQSRGKNRGLFVGGAVGRVSTRRQATVGAQFMMSLTSLMDNLSQAQPYFVRCIKSNGFLEPKSFDDDMVLRQLRYTGMLETVRIRKSGYSVRYTLEDFRQLYSPLLRNFPSIQEFLSYMHLDANHYQIGRTKIFMRSNLHTQLQQKLNQLLDKNVVILQRWARMCVQRLRFLKIRRAVINVQSWFRGHVARKMFYEEKERVAAALSIQSVWRRHVCQKKYRSMKRAAVVMQRSWRSMKEREKALELVTKRWAELGEKEKEMIEAAEIPRSRSSNFNRASRSLSNFSESDEQQPRHRRSTEVRVQHSSQDLIHMLRASMTSPTTKRNNTRVRKMAEAYRKRLEEHSLTAKSKAQPLSQESLSSIFRERKVSQALAGSWHGKTSEQPKLSSQRSPLSERKRQDEPKAPEVKPKPEISPQVPEERLETEKEIVTKTPLNDVHLRKRHGVANLPAIKIMESDFVPHILKPTTFIRLAKCSACSKIMSGLFKQGLKCSVCNLAFHRHCADEKAPCSIHGNAHISTPPATNVIRSSRDLAEIERYFSSKIACLQEQTEQSGKRDNVVDVVFKSALREFHKNLLSLSAMKTQQGNDYVFVPVTSVVLHKMFSEVLEKVLDVKQIAATFPVTMGVNAFKSLLDEFSASRCRKPEEKTPVQRRQKRRMKMNRKEKKIEYFKHKFKEESCNVQTVCEVCNQSILLLECSYVCRFCKVICHENCIQRIRNKCLRNQNATPFDAKGKLSLSELATQPGSRTPLVLESCLHFIEVKGLYTEGIYRRSGSSVEIRRLLKELKKSVSAVSWDSFSVFCVAAVVKQFLRDLPEPLITFRFYPDFLQATEIPDAQERYDAMCHLASQLPKANRNTLERVVFHLARVAQHEKTNKMSAYNLAVIFSQCLMLPPEGTSSLDSLADLPKQRMSVECLIDGQKAKIKAVLSDIDYLDAESYTRSKYLSNISTEKERPSMALIASDGERTGDPVAVIAINVEELDSAQRLVEQELEELENQRSAVTESIILLAPPQRAEVLEETIAPEASDEEPLRVSFVSSEDDLDSCEEYALTFDLPAAPSKLRHINLSRAKSSKRRAPSRRFRILALSNVQ